MENEANEIILNLTILYSDTQKYIGKNKLKPELNLKYRKLLFDILKEKMEVIDSLALNNKLAQVVMLPEVEEVNLNNFKKVDLEKKVPVS